MIIQREKDRVFQKDSLKLCRFVILTKLDERCLINVSLQSFRQINIFLFLLFNVIYYWFAFVY